MAIREERVARNEVLFREVNERIAEASARSEFDGPMICVCECANADCAESLEVTREEYETIRAQPTFFLVVSGHQDAVAERVVDETARFAVVEKLGQAGRIAQAHDPRG